MSTIFCVTPEGKQLGYFVDCEPNESFVVVDEPPEDVRQIWQFPGWGSVVVDVLAAIAARRFTAEVAGITVAGVPVYTDRTTQNKLTAAAFRALRDSEYTVDWKCTNGSFITLNAEQITAIADAVGDYVQACYTREGELVAAFNEGTYTEEMLEEGWPA